MSDSALPRDQVFSPEDGSRVRLLTCVRCGSHHIHRSHPRNPLEHLVRAVTPLRFHRCSECGQRGYHWTWSAPRGAHPEEQVRPAPGGPSRAYRDTLAARIRRRRIVQSILIATVLGVLASAVALTR